MLTTVQQVASTLGEDIRSGRKSMADIDFSQLSNDLLSNMNADDIDAFQQQLDETPGGAMTAVFKLMSTASTLVGDMRHSGEATDEMSDLLASVMTKMPTMGMH